MTTIAARSATVIFTVLAMLSFLLGLVALVGLGRPDRTAVYFVVTVASVAVVAMLMRRDYRRRRAEEATLPPEVRSVRRVPRSAISFPLKESVITFAFWYAVAAVVDRVVNGYTSTFTLAAIAPFAAFMFTTLTVAGRHIAFRLTAEEDPSAPSGPPRI